MLLINNNFGTILFMPIKYKTPYIRYILLNLLISTLIFSIHTRCFSSSKQQSCEVIFQTQSNLNLKLALSFLNWEEIASDAYGIRFGLINKIPSLTTDEARILGSYTSGLYYALNESLYLIHQNKKQFSLEKIQAIKTVTNTLNSALSKLELYTGQVIRVSDELPSEVVEQLRNQTYITFHPFTSSSLNFPIYSPSVYRFIIFTRSGRIVPHSYKPNENEVIIPNKTRFKIINRKLVREKRATIEEFHLVEI